MPVFLAPECADGYAMQRLVDRPCQSVGRIGLTLSRLLQEACDVGVDVGHASGAKGARALDFSPLIDTLALVSTIRPRDKARVGMRDQCGRSY